MFRLFILMSLQLMFFAGNLIAEELSFQSTAISPRSRIDAVAYLGKGVVLAGTRGTHPGEIHKSTDYGINFERVGKITGDDHITCLYSGGNGTAYLLTGDHQHVWRTDDYGTTWQDMGQISKAFNPNFKNAYSLIVTQAGTVLVADADIEGGHIHRSIDRGQTWEDVGKVSTHALYRLVEVGDGIIANGWAGHIYKSTDEGKTWKDQGKLLDSDLYAIEYIGNNTVLIGTKSGHVFSSNDNGKSWKNQGLVGDAADDFSWLGGNRVLYSTYSGKRHLFVSSDAGQSWTRLGKVPTGIENDWLDHVIFINDEKMKAVVGGTNKGFILFSRLTPHLKP